jgi:hypothetical protein
LDLLAGENENGLDKPDSRHRDKQLSDLWNPETNHFSNYAMDTSDENHKSVLRVCMEETKDAKLSILLDSIQVCSCIHSLRAPNCYVYIACSVTND